MVPVVANDQNSYRIELGGQLGVLSFVISVKLPLGSYILITVHDGLSDLNRVGVEAEYIKFSVNHVDMILMISKL